MKAEEIDRLEPREIDALVAERVMGWTVHHDRGKRSRLDTVAAGVQCIVYHGDEREPVQAVWRWDPFMSESFPFSPTGTIEDDLAVLEHAREAWQTGRQMCDMRDALTRMWDERSRQRVGIAVVRGGMEYEVGDYARAALAAASSGGTDGGGR